MWVIPGLMWKEPCKSQERKGKLQLSWGELTLGLLISTKLCSMGTGMMSGHHQGHHIARQYPTPPSNAASRLLGRSQQSQREVQTPPCPATLALGLAGVCHNHYKGQCSPKECQKLHEVWRGTGITPPCAGQQQPWSVGGICRGGRRETCS